MLIYVHSKGSHSSPKTLEKIQDAIRVHILPPPNTLDLEPSPHVWYNTAEPQTNLSSPIGHTFFHNDTSKSTGRWPNYIRWRGARPTIPRTYAYLCVKSRRCDCPRPPWGFFHSSMLSNTMSSTLRISAENAAVRQFQSRKDIIVPIRANKAGKLSFISRKLAADAVSAAVETYEYLFEQARDGSAIELRGKFLHFSIYGRKTSVPAFLERTMSALASRSPSNAESHSLLNPMSRSKTEHLRCYATTLFTNFYLALCWVGAIC